jgi:hypothetical protein
VEHLKGASLGGLGALALPANIRLGCWKVVKSFTTLATGFNVIKLFTGVIEEYSL